MMQIIGLTGSIAAGKSTVAKWINELGIATHDADLVVHELLGPGGKAVAKVLKVFGAHFGCLDMGINRDLLGNEVFAAPEKRNQLESILHPLVCEHRDAFLMWQLGQGALVVVLNVPLLFETSGDLICDYTIVVHASVETTAARALIRPGMTREKLSDILAAQIPTDEKIIRADLALDSDLSKEETFDDLVKWLSKIGISILSARQLRL
ncbi:dephospho-CoA kinase [Candidatus Puniceispirillum sp.]|nr:dephospho-CoA kinase [Candidatus Puniceispirillum sp.]